jgi:hypothetical protein
MLYGLPSMLHNDTDSAFPEMVVEFIHDTLDQAVGVSQTPGPALSVV